MPAPALRSLWVALLVGAAPAPALAQTVVTGPVARLGESWLSCSAESATAERCARALLRRVRAEAEQDYVAAQALHATPAEIEAVRAYDLAFRAHDRTQRTRKLAELERRLTDAALAADERARLEAFRATLQRLAQYEADVEAGVEPRVDPDAAQMAQWVERSKLEAALYRRYGGVIGVNAAGHYAHGARAALVLDYLNARTLEFVDRDVEAAFKRLLAAPPAIVFRGGLPDFTPFWQRAIPSSYMPD